MEALGGRMVAVWKPWAGGGWQCGNLGLLVGRAGGWVVWWSEGVRVMRSWWGWMGLCYLFSDSFSLSVSQSGRKSSDLCHRYIYLAATVAVF